MTGREPLTSRVRTFLLEPDMFFRQLADTPARYRGPLLIALISGVCSVISTWLVMSWMTSPFVEGYAGTAPEAGLLSSLFWFITLVASASALFTPFVIIIVAGLGFYILAGFVSKGGSLSHALTAAGWGMIPLAIYEAVRIPLVLVFLPSMSITISPEFFTTLKNSSSMASVDKGAMAHMITYNQVFYSYTMTDACLHVLAFLCCAWFWIPAVRNTCAVGHRQAVMIVLVPLLLYLALSFCPTLISGGHGL